MQGRQIMDRFKIYFLLLSRNRFEFPALFFFPKRALQRLISAALNMSYF